MRRSFTDRRLAVVLAADAVGYSKLMGDDEPATIQIMRRAHDEIIAPSVRAGKGRILKTAGDGYLVEFASATNALACAIAWQSKLAALNDASGREAPLEFRIGIHLGEIATHGDEVYGDGINIAARVEALTPPGGICVTAAVRDAVSSMPGLKLEDLGPHELKNIKSPVQLYGVSTAKEEDTAAKPGVPRSTQAEIRYCSSKDGTSIAHTATGEGYPLLFAGSWMTHLEWDADNPSYGDYLSHLCQHYRVIRYDQRGNGMSDWENVDISFEKMVDDMEAVIDQYDFDRLAILGMSQGASVAISYLQRHPERVSHLILNGAYARGRRKRGSEKDAAESESLVTFIRHGWASENPAFRQLMTSLFMPDATPEEARRFNEFQKACAPGENMARFREVFDEMDVSGLLPGVSAPTLIVHSDEDAIAPISEGRLLASKIPGARFIKLESKNHMMFANEPAFPKLIESIVDFLP